MADERLPVDEFREASDQGGEPEAKGRRGGFGARLAAARLARGLDEADVARALNLRVGVIAALEAEDRSRLPGLAFVRGYLRAYGRLLEFPESEVQAALAAWRDPGEEERLPLSPASVTVSKGVGGLLHGHAGLVMTVLSVVAAVAVLLFLVATWPEGGLERVAQETPAERQTAPTPAATPGRVPVAPPVPRVSQPAETPEAAPSVEEPTVEAVAEAAPATAPATASATAPATASAPESVAGEPPAAPAGLEIQRERADDGSLLRVLAGGEDRLHVRFSEDCWVEIRDAEGRDLHGDLHRAGHALELYGTGPFRVLLGYAHGVAMVYNGESVDVTPHIRNDVASLVVGR